MTVSNVVMAIAIVIAASASANAQSRAMGSFGGYFTTFLGLTAGGAVTEPRLTFGASVAVLVDERGRRKTALSGAAALKSTETALLGPAQGWMVDRFGSRGIVRAP